MTKAATIVTDEMIETYQRDGVVLVKVEIFATVGCALVTWNTLTAVYVRLH